MFSLVVLLFFAGKVNATDYKATVFGIKSDGITNNTASIQRAIDYISENGGGRLIFYVGRYLTGSFELKSNVTIRISSGAVLVSTPNVYEYKGEGQPALIYAKDCENISVEGVGVIEGSGQIIQVNVADQVAKGHIKNAKEQTPALITFLNCKKVTVKEITMQNAPTSALVFQNCQELTTEKLYIFNKVLPTPALTLSGCVQTTIKDCYFDTLVEPLVTDGTSKGLTFINCVTPKGKQVKSEK